MYSKRLTSITQEKMDEWSFKINDVTFSETLNNFWRNFSSRTKSEQVPTQVNVVEKKHKDFHVVENNSERKNQVGRYWSEKCKFIFSKYAYAFSQIISVQPLIQMLIKSIKWYVNLISSPDFRIKLSTQKKNHCRQINRTVRGLMRIYRNSIN